MMWWHHSISVVLHYHTFEEEGTYISIAIHHKYTYAHIHINVRSLHPCVLHMGKHAYTNVCIRMYLCMYMYMYMHMHMFMQIHTHNTQIGNGLIKRRHEDMTRETLNLNKIEIHI